MATTITADGLTQAQLDSACFLAGASIDAQGYTHCGRRHLSHATVRRLAAAGVVELREDDDGTLHARLTAAGLALARTLRIDARGRVVVRAPSVAQ
jgi:hypothetical protein